MNIPAAHFYIVDDDLSFCVSLKRLLNARGISAEFFGSARSFLDSVPVAQHGYAVIDINMPECDGFELIDKMTVMHYSMPMIMITGQTQADSRDLTMKKGALGFLQKPFSEESLLELVDQYERNNSSHSNL